MTRILPVIGWGSLARRGGYFLSKKLHRFVQYESGLERRVFETFDRDGRVIAYQEQPIRLKVRIDGGWVPYTPDAIALVHHDDGQALVPRAIAMELKPSHHLAYLPIWLRVRALWQWCCQHGAGMVVGSAHTTVLDLYAQAEQTPLRSELTDAVNAGPIDRERYLQFKRDNNASMSDIARAVTALQLDWRADPLRITHPSPTDQKAVRELWNTVALASIALETQPL